MTPALLLELTIRPTLATMRVDRLNERAILLLAIAMQESGLTFRRQMPSGPARSWWQIEPPTARDTLTRHAGARTMAEQLGCSDLESALQWCDALGCAIAAGLVHLCPLKLPMPGEESYSWTYYLRAWRPGKPDANRWPKAYRAALKAGARDE